MTMLYDFEAYRKMLPAAEKYIYLNSAGCGPLPEPVFRNMVETLNWMYEEGQILVEVHDQLFAKLEKARAHIARFIGAEPGEIFFVRCIAEGINTVDYMLDLGPEDQVLVSNQENPASLLPFYAAGKIRGFETKSFCVNGNFEEILNQFSKALNKQTKLVVFSHVLHSIGTKMPAKEMCEIAREKHILTALDGAQAMGNSIINVKEIGCDFYILSCHKWLCGPEGVAAVYVRKDLIPSLRVSFGGVGMQESFDITTCDMELHEDARRFEYGGKMIPMYMAFSDTIELAQSMGMGAVTRRQRQLNDYCRKRFTESLPQAKILSPDDDRLKCGIFAASFPGVDHRRLVKVAFLRKKIIIQYRTINLETKEEGIRISNNWFVREEEIDQLVEFLIDYLKEIQ